MASKLTTAPAVYEVYKCNFYPGVLVRMNPGAMQPATDTCAIYGGEHRFALGICRGTDGIDYVTWAAGGYSPLRHPTAIGEDLFTLIPSKIMGATWWFKVNGSWQVQQELQKQVRTTTYTRVSRVDIWLLDTPRALLSRASHESLQPVAPFSPLTQRTHVFTPPYMP